MFPLRKSNLSCIENSVTLPIIPIVKSKGLLFSPKYFGSLTDLEILVYPSFFHLQSFASLASMKTYAHSPSTSLPTHLFSFF